MQNGRFRLFHLEDDDNDAFLFATALKRTQGACDLTRFGTAVDAIEYLERIRSVETEAPHLIITDFKMPRMSGFEFVRWLRQSRFSCMPVVVLSGSSLATDVLEAYRSGANSFSTKPVNGHQLNELIGAVLKYWHEVSITPTHVGHGRSEALSAPPSQGF